jgi:phthalate 4,5-cis-dihydrodiol dehydrogenase
VLGGGLLRSVRAYAGQWMPERPIPGYYTAYLEFENGVPVTITHNGYGYFMGSEMVLWGHANQRYTPEERVAVRKSMRDHTRDEEQDKQDIRIGGSKERTVFRPAHNDRINWVPEDLGLLIVSGERGDLKHSAQGVYVYNDEGRREIDLTPDRFMGGAGQRRAELEEIYDAVVFGKPLWHDGRWGMATLEVVLGIIESARERKEVRLTHQKALPDDYDAEFTL